jgi:Zn-dependent peptidase ImmA (M78 family)
MSRQAGIEAKSGLMEPRIGFSREMARKYLKKHKVTEPPVPVEAIVKAEGFQLHWVDYPDDTSGESWWEGAVGHIAVNRRHHPNRKRFTMAHELGHLVMRHTKYRLEDHSILDGPRARPGTDEASEGGEEIEMDSRDPVEVEANQFAAELLMPLALFKKEWQGGTDVPTLAKRYRVSEEAAWWRVRGFPMT